MSITRKTIRPEARKKERGPLGGVPLPVDKLALEIQMEKVRRAGPLPPDLRGIFARTTPEQRMAMDSRRRGLLRRKEK